MKHLLLVIAILFVSISYGQDLETFTEVYSRQGEADYNIDLGEWVFDSLIERKVLVVFNFNGNRDIKVILPDGGYSMLYNWTQVEYVNKAGEPKAFVLDAYFEGHLVRGILFNDEFRVIIDSFTMLRWVR